METSTFSLSAHSLTSSVLALLAPGTQWSQKPIVSLPAACAVRIYGAVISAADDIAVAATNCRRESFLRDMAFLPGEPIGELKLLCFWFIYQPGRKPDCWPLRRFDLIIRAGLPGVYRETACVSF